MTLKSAYKSYKEEVLDQSIKDGIQLNNEVLFYSGALAASAIIEEATKSPEAAAVMKEAYEHVLSLPEEQSYTVTPPNYPLDMKNFFEHFDLPHNAEPGLIPDSIAKFRIRLMKEETREYVNAVTSEDPEQILDALTDIIFVAFGTVVSYGYDIETAWERVLKSNLDKIRGATRRSSSQDVDLIKPTGWKPPYLGDLV